MFDWLKKKAAATPAEGERDFPFDYDALMARAEAARAAHAAAEPYPHSVFDDFLPESLARRLHAAVPAPERGKWDYYSAAGFEEKWALSDDRALPPLFRALSLEMNSSSFIRFLQTLTGIEHLLPDPHLFGGGIHLVPNGGVLQVHSDFNWSESLQAHRRVNVFVYLNPRWREEWGGALELWDAQARAPVRIMAALFNRMVIFNSRSDTFHGHPHPITCPPEEWRQSFAMYYYSSSRPEHEVRPAHNTLYKGVHVE